MQKTDESCFSFVRREFSGAMIIALQFENTKKLKHFMSRFFEIHSVIAALYKNWPGHSFFFLAT